MANHVNEDRLYDLYKKGLAAQVKKGGFPLTYTEIQKAWGYSKKSKAMASRYMPMMESRGYAQSRKLARGRDWLFCHVENEPVPFNDKPEKKVR